MAEEAVSQEQEQEDKESSILGTGFGSARRRRATGIYKGAAKLSKGAAQLS